MRPSKRDELVDRALTVFDRAGYHAAGMDLVAAETGVSKTAIYNHFRSKDDLIAAVLERRHLVFRGWLMDRVGTDGSPRARLLRIFDVLRDWAASPDFRGCMFIKAVAEFQGADDPLRRAAVAHKETLRADLEALAQEAQLPDPAALSRQLLILIDGATVSARLGRGPGAFDDARQVAQVLIGH